MPSSARALGLPWRGCEQLELELFGSATCTYSGESESRLTSGGRAYRAALCVAGLAALAVGLLAHFGHNRFNMTMKRPSKATCFSRPDPV